MKFLKTFLAALLAFVVGSFLFVVIWVVILVGLAGSMDHKVKVPSKAVLMLDFAELVTDAPSSDPFAGFDPLTLQATPQISLMSVLRAVEAAETDDRIEGIYLRMNGTGGCSMAQIEEIRAALENFRTSGKFIIAYNETYTQGQYYLASVADALYIQPEGGLDWSGLSTNIMMYKGLLDKLDIRVEVFRPTACKYKSAVEPYILSRMSDANREQMQALVNSLWNTISDKVCEARGIAPETMRRITDNLEATLPEEALALGFVDGLRYEDEMEEVFAELGVDLSDEGDCEFITLGDYTTQVGIDPKRLTADQVAVVYASGQIVDGEGSGSDIYGNTLAATLRDVRLDGKVKSVVLRVDSPGGSALASDVIWREMELLRAEKPVVVSMGSYAASGGYYISCPADFILADELTLTGSIGVFGMFPYTADALKNKLGITLDGVKTNTSAGMGTLAPLTAAERASIMRGVDKVYESFTGKVADGRNLTVEHVLDIAGGRVWSGRDALEIGLVDGLGGLREAIAVAADKAGLGENFRVREVVEEPSGLAAIISALNARVHAAFDTTSELGALMHEYKQVRDALSVQGIVMYEPRILRFE